VAQSEFLRVLAYVERAILPAGFLELQASGQECPLHTNQGDSLHHDWCSWRQADDLKADASFKSYGINFLYHIENKWFM
jgi:hypothetical protein